MRCEVIFQMKMPYRDSIYCNQTELYDEYGPYGEYQCEERLDGKEMRTECFLSRCDNHKYVCDCYDRRFKTN